MNNAILKTDTINVKKIKSMIKSIEHVRYISNQPKYTRDISQNIDNSIKIIEHFATAKKDATQLGYHTRKHNTYTLYRGKYGIGYIEHRNAPKCNRLHEITYHLIPYDVINGYYRVTRYYDTQIAHRCEEDIDVDTLVSEMKNNHHILTIELIFNGMNIGVIDRGDI